MAEEAMRAQIAQKRMEIDADLDALSALVRTRTTALTDWQGFLRARPLLPIGAGLAFGFFLGWATGGH